LTEAVPSQESHPRMSTGVQGLDTVLQGGLLPGGTYMVAGGPGSGKTVLGNQVAFQHVAQGGRAVYVTLLAESHGRMMMHLGAMSFLRREFIGHSLHYVSGYATLKTEGVEGLLRLLYRSVREHQASLLVMDGMLPVQEVAESRLAFREFLHNLGVHNALASCTTLLLTNQHDNMMDPQFTMVDGVLELGMQSLGCKVLRTLQVPKFRGTQHLLGLHTVDISNQGITVYPRTESLVAFEAPPQSMPEQRLGFGVPRLDEMLSGGVPAHSATLLFGSPGSGKTLLGLHFLAAGASQGENGLYYGFAEPEAWLVNKGTEVGLPIQHWLDSGQLKLKVHTSVERALDARVRDLLEQVERHQVKRLVLDGLEPFAQDLLAQQRLASFFHALFQLLRARGVTSLVTQQTHVIVGPDLKAPIQGIESLVDNILLLRFVELRSQLYRMLSVLKMRESRYDSALRQFDITSRGIIVADTFESAEAILTGLSRPPPPKPKKSGPSRAGRRASSTRRGRA
jgi:circadian clock protein KaiC